MSAMSFGSIGWRGCIMFKLAEGRKGCDLWEICVNVLKEPTAQTLWRDASCAPMVILGDAGAIAVCTLWGGASRYHAALDSALTGAAEGLWPKVSLTGIEVKEVGKVGDASIVRLSASDSSTVKLEPATSLVINVSDAIFVKDYAELAYWEAPAGPGGTTQHRCRFCKSKMT